MYKEIMWEIKRIQIIEFRFGTCETILMSNIVNEIKWSMANDKYINEKQLLPIAATNYIELRYEKKKIN